MTYDQDLEDMVQGFCESQEWFGAEAPQWLLQGCRHIMALRKRDIVGAFLGVPLVPSRVPGLRAQICRDLVQACPSDLADFGRVEHAPRVSRVGAGTVSPTHMRGVASRLLCVHTLSNPQPHCKRARP